MELLNVENKMESRYNFQSESNYYKKFKHSIQSAVKREFF